MRKRKALRYHDDHSNDYALLIENMVNAVAHHRVITDQIGNPIDYVFVEVNNAFEDMTGLERQDVIGKRVTKVIPGIEKDEFDWIGVYANVALTGESVTFEQYSKPLHRWYSVAAFSPKAEEFVTVFTDITEHVKTEERLRATIRQLKQTDRAFRLLSSGNQTMLKAQEETQLLDDICRVAVNTGRYSLAWIGYVENASEPSIKLMAAYGEDNTFIERTITATKIHGDDSPFSSALTTGETVVFNQLRNRPEGWWGRILKQHGFSSVIALPLNVEETTIGILSIYTTESKAFKEREVKVLNELANDLSYGIAMLRTHKELSRSRHELLENSVLLEAILESTAEGILVVGSDGAIIYRNRQFLELWQMPEHVADIADQRKRLNYLKNQLLNPNGFVERVENLMGSSLVDTHYYRFKDGRVLEGTSYPFIKQEKGLGRIWIFRNLTPLIQAKNRSELYLDLMTHDLGNALQGISIGLDILRMNEDAVRQVAPVLNQMEEALERCTGLITKTHDIKGINREELDEVSLTEVLNECVDDLRGTWKDVDVQIDMPDEDIIIIADSYLKQLIMNLLENAIIHNESKSKDVYIHVRGEDQGYILSVADNGPGFESDRREELLDPGRRFGGIGLHIVSQITEKYGGYVDVHDRIKGSPTSGAEFSVWFPSIERGKQFGHGSHTNQKSQK